MNSLDKFQHSIPIIAILFILSLPLSAFFLRQNNLGMVERRDEVIRIDEQTGDLTQIEPALKELRSYVLTHMNASLGSAIELPGAYNKAVEQARQEAEASGSANGEIYRQAQKVCEDPNIVLSARAQCIQDYVTRNAKPGSDPQELKFPAKELYSYEYISPTWSPDWAGFSVLINIFLFLWLTVLVVSRVVLKRLRQSIENDPLE